MERTAHSSSSAPVRPDPPSRPRVGGHSGTLAQATVLSLWMGKQTCQRVPAMNLAGVGSAQSEIYGRAQSDTGDPGASATAPDLKTPLVPRSRIAPDQPQDSPAQSAVCGSSGAVERLAAQRVVVCSRGHFETALIRTGSCRRHRHNRDRHQARGEQNKRRSAYVHLAESIRVSGNGSGVIPERWPSRES